MVSPGAIRAGYITSILANGQGRAVVTPRAKSIIGEYSYDEIIRKILLVWQD